MRRRVLAAGLERAVREARRGRHGRTAAVPVAEEEVLLAEPALLELADRLRDRDVAPETVGRVRALLTDAESPLHAPDHTGALREWVWEVLS